MQVYNYLIRPRLEHVEIIFILKISTGFPHFGTRLAIQRDI